MARSLSLLALIFLNRQCPVRRSFPLGRLVSLLRGGGRRFRDRPNEEGAATWARTT